MNGVSIRDREPADLSRCVAILADVHRLDRYPLNWPDDPQRWLAPVNVLHAWVAETADGTVVGHVAVHRAAASTAEVSRLFVAPAARGNNVAAELLRSARQWATVHRLRLVLEIVDGPRSAAAIAVYERTGWQHTRTTTADWTTPDGQPVRLRRYTLASEASSKMP